MSKMFLHNLFEILLPSSQKNYTNVRKTALGTRYRQCKYFITSFGLPRALRCFRTQMNDTFKPYLKNVIVVHRDETLFYSKIKQEHFDHLKIVLKNQQTTSYTVKCQSASLLRVRSSVYNIL